MAIKPGPVTLTRIKRSLRPRVRPRNYIFLKDVLLLALTAFGGPQAHIAMMFRLMVEKRRYLTEKELIELNALCQILPGPTSTQTVTAIGYRIGGPNLAYLTLLVWVAPGAIIMTIAGLIITTAAPIFTHCK